MKKILAILVATYLLTGCAAIMKYSNIMNMMETYVFNVPADVAYAGAVEMFDQVSVHIDATGKNKGESEWVSKHGRLGDKSYTDMSRFLIEVTPSGESGSIVHIYRQTQSNITGGWLMGNPNRSPSHEYTLLQKVDPAGAAELDQKAARMAGM